MFDSVLSQLGVVAVFVQRVIDLVGETYKGYKYVKQINIALSVVISSLLCVAWQVDAFAAAGIVFQLVWLGAALTGLVAGLGSNVLNDLLDLLRMWKEQRKLELQGAKQFWAESGRIFEDLEE